MVKTNKYENESIWQAFLKPLLAWLKSFKPKTDAEIDMVDNAEYQIKRGNRNAGARQNIVKSLKVEFEFDEWKSIRLDKKVLDSLKKDCKLNRPIHIQFFKDAIIKPVKTVKGETYDLTAEQYADLQYDADLRLAKNRYKAHGSRNGTFEAFVMVEEED
jgi:hypothetical protein